MYSVSKNILAPEDRQQIGHHKIHFIICMDDAQLSATMKLNCQQRSNSTVSKDDTQFLPEIVCGNNV